MILLRPRSDFDVHIDSQFVEHDDEHMHMEIYHNHIYHQILYECEVSLVEAERCFILDG